MKKRVYYYVPDNTILDCPEVNYKYNYDTYNREKNLFWGISILGLLISFSMVIISKNNTIQSVAAAFMGGILSLLVWLFTIRQQDRINFELANIDMHVMKIDEILELQHSKTQFINPDEEELVDVDCEDIGKRFLLLLQITLRIISDKGINASALKLHFLNNEEITAEEFIKRSEELLFKHEFREVATDKEWDRIISWNNWYLDWQLNDLKKKLIRYKMYILCGNVPQSYSDINKVKRKGK